MNRLTWCCLIGLSSALAAACGGSGGDDNNGGEGETGGAPSGGGGGAPGAGGSLFGQGGLGCGQTRCFPAEGSTEEPCCIDAFASRCGIKQTMLGTTSCVDIPTPPDPNCTDKATFGGVVTLNPCCAPSGKCGLDGSMFGQSCVEWSEVASQATRFGQTVTVPPEKTCTP